MGDAPHAPDWRAALHRACEAARCGAQTRSGCPCRGPAMPNGRCRMHGGGSKGAVTADGQARARLARLTHGRRSAAYLAHRAEERANYLRLRDMVRDANAQMRAEMAANRELLRRLGRRRLAVLLRSDIVP